ncbi:thioesterase superfamily protein [Phlyctema vagabunda]|uniref:Thioesterase superfamily protein n=1 Tax=Phlyctema vagabunda TaxID=108571 RepID=A0ABR4PBP4_9HELO
MPLARHLFRPGVNHLGSVRRVLIANARAKASPIQFFSIHARLRTAQTLNASLPPPAKRHILVRVLIGLATTVFFSSAGFVMATIPAIQAANGLLNPPSDAETLSLYTPEDSVAQEVEDFIKNHPVAVELRSNPVFSESRPHMKIPESQRSHNLTGGTLMGPGKVVVPPFTWSEAGGKSLVQISYLGSDLCGHAGIVHGGLLATMLDEGLARCCFAALPNKVGLTANLNINYRTPAPADTFVVLRAKTVKVEGRKAWVEGHIETLVGEGEKPVILVEASALFVEPKQAATMARIYPVQ